jgi:hypothetical protein
LRSLGPLALAATRARARTCTAAVKQKMFGGTPLAGISSSSARASRTEPACSHARMACE